METNYHNPVLLKESVDGLDIREDGIYVDATFGGGGHTREILNRLGPDGKLIAFDQDEEALENAPDDPRFRLLQENFRHIRRFLKFYGIQKVNGILADFGVSSHQFDSPERGFSTRFNSDLDMRMSKGNKRSAKEVINTYSQEALKNLFSQYGELRNAGAIARQLVQQRRETPINTTGELVDTLKIRNRTTAERRFSSLPAGQYKLELILDRNRNGRWDPGDYERGLQPEPLQIISLEPLRANWDLEVDVRPSFPD